MAAPSANQNSQAAALSASRCARDHRVTHAAAHGPGFAGHHRLVHLGGAVDDDTVGGHAGAGPHDHDVVEPQVRGCHSLGAVFHNALCLVGQ